MIARRAWFAAPAAVALLLIAGVTSATAAVDDGPPTGPPDGAVFVAETPGDVALVFGVEVSARAITWSSMFSEEDAAESEIGLETSGRAFTPDLGQAPLALGAAIDMPFPDTILATSSDRWAIGIGQSVEGDGVPVLLAKPAGGAVREHPVPGMLDALRSSIALWDDTALIGNTVVNLVTGQVTVIEGECLEAMGAVLADGVLLFNDTCAEGVLAVDVSPGGFRESDLDAARLVTETEAEYLAYSRGLLVLASNDGGGGYALAWGRLDEAEMQQQLLPSSGVLGVRAHGERFAVIIAVDEDLFGVVYEASDATEAVAVVPLRNMFTRPPPEVEGLAASPGGEMQVNLFAGIDLFGRTLAWHDDGSIYAMTLPVLSGGSVSISAPAGARAGATVTVTGSGFAPWEEVAVWLNSDPQLLAMGYAGADGSVSLSVRIPAGVAGAHTVSLFGVESGWGAGSALAVQGVNPGLDVRTGR